MWRATGEPFHLSSKATRPLPGLSYECSWGRANARLRTVAMSSENKSSEDDSAEFSSVRVDSRVLDLLHITHADLWGEPQRHPLSDTIRELMQRERERQRQHEGEQ
jgi:hypothetical protein